MKKSITTAELSMDRSALARVPHIDQWDGLWMMDPSRLNFLASVIGSMDVSDHLNRGFFDEPTAADYREDRDGVAIISANGTLQKHAMSVGQATSTVLVRRAIRDAVSDSKVNSILISVESPGGTAAGTKEVADEITAASKHKPVHAHITDMGCSAAYWIASSAQRLTANEMALVGSIGTYQVVQDLSSMAESEGVKVHVIKAGAFKGTGTPGTELTSEQLSYLQGLIESMNANFVAGIASGRGFSAKDAQSVADGRCHMAADAKALRLIDGVMSFDDAFDEVRDAGENPKAVTSRVTKAKPGSMTPDLIRQSCPGCSDTFVVSMLNDGHSIDRCRDQYMKSLVKANEDLTKQLAEMTTSRDELRAKVDDAAMPGVGVEGMKIGGRSYANQCNTAAESFWSAVAEEQAKGRSRQAAMANVNRRDPNLRQFMIDEANENRQ